MFRRGAAFVTGLALLVAAIVVATMPSASAVAVPEVAALSAAPAPPSTNVHVFYYPWYGNPAGQGSYLHWDQGGHVPPQDIGASLYPTLGAYDSGDPATIDKHMAWIARAGAGVIVYSWWGQGSQPDTLAARVLDSAARYGIKVAWHLEPYGARTAASTVADINYINSRYGSNPAFYRDSAHGNRGVYYVFESLRIADWSALDQVRSSALVLAQTTDLSKVAHFGGIYTYDVFAAVAAQGWAAIADYCRANGLVWAPSVGPGYIDDRASPGNTTPTLGRDNGATYDRQWTNALATKPTWVSITSFNEWHEGSTIEPATTNPPAGHSYQTYSGAYGTTGPASETAYLDRTRYWVDRSNVGVKVMPLGDSITDGFSVPGGYRINLWQRLTAGGYTVDFVGSGVNGPASLGDHDHEGHSGWRIDQIDANIVGWLQTYAPRTILLQIGTNDMNQNYDIANAPARLSALIDKVRANSPTVELFVAQITPENNPTLESRVQAFNAAIPGIVSQKGPHTHLVDMHSVLTIADLADGVHPSAAGYDKMGARWFSALQSVSGSLVGGTVISLRARINGKYVTAENAGAAPLIANRTAIGSWEQFDSFDVGGGYIALRAHANGQYVGAENAGAQPLIANRDVVGSWERFQLIRNSDGSASLRAGVNGRYVTAENAGNSSLVANRTAIGSWEKFDLIA